MRVAVFGAGGTGGYFGGLLAKAGEDVSFIARGEHLRAILAEGLTVRSKMVGDFTVRANATDNPAEIGPVDLVLFCVKTYDNDAAERLRPLVGPETMVLSVQNGIDHAERLARVLGEGHVVGCTVGVSAIVAAPGVIEHRAIRGLIRFGELPRGTSQRTAQLKELFERAEIVADERPDIQVAIWEKFVMICAVSGVTALTRLPLGPILACAETAELFRGTMEEVEAVGHASGVALAAGTAQRTFDGMSRSDPRTRGSMAHDLETGRRLEVETLNGTVVRLGSERGIPTPCNFAIYAALKPYADGPPELP